MTFRRCFSFVMMMVATSMIVPPAIADHHEDHDHVGEHAVDKAEFMKKFIGTWNIDEGYDKGREIAEEELDGTTTVITEDSITTYDREKNETYKAKYTLDFTHDPVHIDMVSTMGGREMKALGIIEFEFLDLDGENEFTLAYSLKPGERPESFESPEGSMIMVMEMEQDD